MSLFLCVIVMAQHTVELNVANHQCWNLSLPTAPSPKLGQEDGRGPGRERQCPFLLPAMQTETEKDQIPKFLFKPRHHG